MSCCADNSLISGNNVEDIDAEKRIRNVEMFQATE
jgi:hypothetical protein